MAEDITFLNINQPITCIAAGPMYRTSDRYYLFVGTQTNVFGYDVENNKDLFFKEVVDGVNCILTGCLSGVELGSGDSLAIAGGNCSLQGFDAEGTDVFWTVTGDNVGAIALLDYDGDGENEVQINHLGLLCRYCYYLEKFHCKMRKSHRWWWGRTTLTSASLNPIKLLAKHQKQIQFRT